MPSDESDEEIEGKNQKELKKTIFEINRKLGKIEQHQEKEGIGEHGNHSHTIYSLRKKRNEYRRIYEEGATSGSEEELGNDKPLEKNRKNYKEKDEGIVYEVEDIVDRRDGAEGPEYLVKWKDWPNDANTWEPEKHLRKLDKLAEFKRCGATNKMENVNKSPKTHRSTRGSSINLRARTRSVTPPKD